MSLWLVYLLVMVPSFKATIGAGLTPVGVGLIIIGGILTVLTLLRGLLGYLTTAPTDDAEKEDRELQKAANDARVSTAWKWVRRTGYVYAFCAALFVMLPNSGQLLTIAGISMVTNIEGVQDLPENVVAAMNNGLKELADMSESVPAAPSTPAPSAVVK